MTTDKEIAERLAQATYPDLNTETLNLIGNDMAYEEGFRIGQFRAAHMRATLALLPRIREAVDTLESVDVLNPVRVAERIDEVVASLKVVLK